MAEACFASSCSFPRYYELDLALAKDLQDKLAQAKAYCNLGLAHKALGEYSRAEECQRYLLSLAQALDNTQVTHTHTPTAVLTQYTMRVHLFHRGSRSLSVVILSVCRRFSGLLATWEMCACVGEIFLEG